MSTVCSNVNSKCAGYDSKKHDSKKPYTCVGHRSSNVSRNFLSATFSASQDFPIYGKGDIIEAIDISSICETLRQEIEERKQHKLYKNANQLTLSVTHGDVIDHDQPNTLSSFISQLSKMVNSNSKYGDTHLGNKIMSFDQVHENAIVETHDVKQFNSAVSRVAYGIDALVQDCICYSDCVSYYKYTKSTPCACVLNYGCGYY